MVSSVRNAERTRHSNPGEQKVGMISSLQILEGLSYQKEKMLIFAVPRGKTRHNGPKLQV